MVRNWLSWFAVLVALAGLSTSQCEAAVSYFSDDFESGLSQWSPNLSGQIVADPLNGSNNVLHFANPGSGGDIFSAQQITTNSTYTLEFDYLALAPHPGGGFVGIQNGNGEHWIAGDNYAGLLIQLDAAEGDEQWHHYQLTFASIIGNSVTLKLEDFSGSDGGAPLNAYFDNIVLRDSAIPEPSSLIVWSALALMGGCIAYRRTRAAT